MVLAIEVTTTKQTGKQVKFSEKSGVKIAFAKIMSRIITSLVLSKAYNSHNSWRWW